MWHPILPLPSSALSAWSVALGRRARFQFSVERWPYVIFFVGVLLTAAGSAYYHLAPDNETLFWDRLPMTIAFMALVASQIVDRINIRAGLALLVPMLLLGAASVVYWRVTERAGAGNVMPYGILQGYSMVILLLMAVLTPSRYTQGNYLYWVFGWYLLSKFLETFDAEADGPGSHGQRTHAQASRGSHRPGRRLPDADAPDAHRTGRARAIKPAAIDSSGAR